MRGLADKTIKLMLYAYDVLTEIQPATLRQLHYTVFSRAEIAYANDRASYRLLGKATSISRRLNRAVELEQSSYENSQLVVKLGFKTIPHEWIIDEGRQAESVSVWDDLHGYVEATKNDYRRDYWQAQPNYVEVWSEKGTVLGSIRPIAHELGFTVRVAHGFGSTGMEGQIGKKFEATKKPITVFYLGDHDPSGHVIEEDIHRRGETASGKDFEMIRLAIHRADIKRFKLPPQKIKPTDSRAAGFQRRFGAKAPTIELDALPVAELRRRVESAVSGLIDWDVWTQQQSTERTEFACIERVVEMWKNLPQMKRPEE
jgi:hypothetical protein